MKDPYQSVQAKNRWLKGISLAFNAAAVMPLFFLVSRRLDRFNYSRQAMEDVRICRKLEDSHPAAKAIHALAQQHGLTLNVLIKNRNRLFQNMAVMNNAATHNGFGRICSGTIVIDGNPCTLPNFPHDFLGIAAHEIAHIKQDDELLAESLLINNLAYPLFALLAPLALSSTALSSYALLSSPVCLAVAVTSCFLRKAEERNNEIRADLMAGRMTGNHDALIGALEYIKVTYGGRVPKHDTLLERLTSSHPHIDTRIAYLGKARDYARLHQPAP